MTRLRAILALALAAAPLTLAACGHPPPSIVVRAQPGDRAGGLTATGSATIGVSPDCADLTLTITREAKDARGDEAVKLKLSLLEDGAQPHAIADVAFPYFGGQPNPHFTASDQGGDVRCMKLPVAEMSSSPTYIGREL